MYSNPRKSLKGMQLARKVEILWSLVNYHRACFYHVLTRIVKVIKCSLLHLASFLTKTSSDNLFQCYALGNIKIPRKQNWVLFSSAQGQSSVHPASCSKQGLGSS